VFDEAQAMLKKIMEQKLLTARGLLGFWPACSVGDDVQVFREDSMPREGIPLATFYGLRQQVGLFSSSNKQTNKQTFYGLRQQVGLFSSSNKQTNKQTNILWLRQLTGLS